MTLAPSAPARAAGFISDTREHVYERPRTVCQGSVGGRILWNPTFRALRTTGASSHGGQAVSGGRKRDGRGEGDGAPAFGARRRAPLVALERPLGLTFSRPTFPNTPRPLPSSHRRPLAITVTDTWRNCDWALAVKRRTRIMRTLLGILSGAVLLACLLTTPVVAG